MFFIAKTYTQCSNVSIFCFPSWRAFKTFPGQEHQWNIYTQAVADKAMFTMVSFELQVKAALFWSWFFGLLTFLWQQLPAHILSQKTVPNSNFQCVLLQHHSSHWNLQIGPESRMMQPVDKNCINWLKRSLAKITYKKLKDQQSMGTVKLLVTPSAYLMQISMEAQLKSTALLL